MSSQLSLFLLLFICLLIILTVFVFTVVSSSERRKKSRESFADFRNNKKVLVTQSQFSFRRVSFWSDQRQVNEGKLSKFLLSVFPMTVSSHRDDSPQMRFRFEADIMPRKSDMQFVSIFSYLSLVLLLPLDTHLSEDGELSHWANLRIGVLRDHAASFFLKKLVNILNLQSVVLEYENYVELVHAWKTQSIRAIFLLCAHPTTFIEKLSFEEEIIFFNMFRFFNLDNRRRNLVAFYFPTMFVKKIPLYSYRVFAVKKTIDGCAFHMLITASVSTPADYVYSFISTLHANFFYLKTAFPLLDGFTESTMKVCPIDLDLHEGARMYYKETNDITEEPQKLCAYTSSGNCDEDTKRRVLTLNDYGQLF